MPRYRGEAWYDTAQVCMNGHMVNESFLSCPQHNRKHCSACGAETTTTCPSCSSLIQGYYYSPRGFVAYTAPVPAFCHECGAPYPWTSSKLEAACELADEIEALDTPERELLKRSIDDIVRDTPQTPLAALRFKKYASKGGAVIIEGFKSILFGLATDAAKKMIWPDT